MSDERSGDDGPEEDLGSGPADATDGERAASTAEAADEWAEEHHGIPRDRAVRMAQVGLVVVAVLIVAVVFLTRGGSDDGKEASTSGKGGDASQTTDPGDGKASWPSEVGGRPPALGERGQKAPQVQVAPDAPPGAYLWSDYDGWHLWFVPGAGVPAVTGTLTSNDDVAKAEAAVPGTGTVQANGKVVEFSLPSDSAALSGIDFNPGFFADQLVFSIDGPDGPLDQNLVYVGSKATPAPFPLVISKGS